MRFILSSILVAVSFLLANLLSSLATAPRTSVIGVSTATVSPFAMMMQAPVNLPVEQYDTH